MTTFRVIAGQPIQSAIDSAGAGDTIVIDPGIYQEQLTKLKNGLTIVASYPLATIIAAPQGALSGNKAIIEALGVTDITLSNLVITGPGSSNSHSLEELVFVSDGAVITILDSVLGNARDEPLGPSQNGYAVFANKGSKVALNGCTLRGYQKGGLLVSDPNTSANVIDCLIMGMGLTNKIAQFGCLAQSGAFFIAHNTIAARHQYGGSIPAPPGNAGFILVGTAPMSSIDGCVSNDNLCGYAILGTSGAILTGNTARNNTNYGFYAKADTGDCKFTGNTASGNGILDAADYGINNVWSDNHFITSVSN